jgi:acetyltransferase-like isoleucine patch superfamily enzyme
MFRKYWNYKLIGLPKFIYMFITVIFVFSYEKINSFFWQFNFGSCGKNIFIQKGTLIRYPKNIFIGDNVSIGKDVEIFTESPYSKLIIGDNSEINKGVQIDFTGNLKIGSNVTISERSAVLTHDHGLNPHSIPQGIELSIDDNVWIGQSSFILSKVSRIGKNAVIAAGSIVTKEVLANTVVAGNPARVIKKI